MPELMNHQGREMFSFPGIFDRSAKVVELGMVPEPPKRKMKEVKEPGKKVLKLGAAKG